MLLTKSNIMGDPLKQLHNNMVNAGLLTEANFDYNSFVQNLAAPEGRQKLYDVLKDNGKVSIDFNSFNQGYFANFEQTLSSIQAEKKKMVAGGQESSAGSLDQTPAPVAAAGSDGTQYNPLTWPQGGDPFLRQPEESPVDLSLTNAQLAEKIQAKSADRQRIAAMEERQAPTAFQAQTESTNVVTPMKQLPEMEVTGEENPMEAGNTIFAKMDAGYELKERKAAKSPWRQGTRDMQKVEAFADLAKKQSDFANFELSEKYGQGWLDELNTLTQELQAPAASVSPEEMMEKQARYNNITQDPAFQKFQAGVRAQQKSYEEYKAIGKRNPEFLRLQAQQEMARKVADESTTFKVGSFLAQSTLPVIAGIASLPRTMLEAVGISEVPIIDQIADWGDKQREFVETATSTGSKSDRQLWENVAKFDGLDVTTDISGKPISAYRNGVKVDMTQEQVQKFIETGAGQKAKLSYTGAENTGWAVAKQLANLYLMRNLGGGTEIGTGAVAFVTTYNDLYNEAIQQMGYSPADAAQYAIANAGVQAAAEAYLGKIDVAPMKLQLARTAGIREAKALAGKLPASEVGKAAGKAIMKEVLGENAEELTQTATDHLVTAMFNAKTGGNIERDFSLQEAAETILLTTATTLLAGGADAPRGAKGQIQANALVAAAYNPAAIQKPIEQLVASGQMTESDGQRAINRAYALSQINDMLPENLTDEQRAQVLALELDKMQVIQSVSTEAPKIVQDQVKSELKAIDEHIEAIKNPEPPKEGEAPVELPVVIQPDTPVAAPEVVQEPTIEELPQASVVSTEVPAVVEAPPAEAAPVETPQESVQAPVAAQTTPPEFVSLFASSGSEAGIQNLITDFYAGSTITLVPSGPGVYDVHNKKGKIEGVAVVKKGRRFQFGSVKKQETQQSTPVVEDPVSLVSPDLQSMLDEADKQNVRQWVNENINDPEIMAEYPDQQTAVRELVKEYEDNVLQNKYQSGQKQQPDTADLQQATDIARTLNDDQAQQVVDVVNQYTGPDGEVDFAKLEEDTKAGLINPPSPIKEIIDEAEPQQPERAESDQRNEGVGSAAQVQEAETGTVSDVNTGEQIDIDEPASGQKKVAKQSREKKITAAMKKAPLPPLDDDVLQELSNDGLIDSDTFFDAHAYLKGDINERTATAFNKALDAREGLRDVPPRTPLIVNDEIQVYRRESDGVIEVSGDTAGSYGLKWFGGKYNPATRKWELKGEGAIDALNHIVDSNEKVVEQKDGGAAGNALVEILNSAGAKMNAKRRRNRFKAASSFAERLRIAEVEHGKRPEVSDPRKVQAVLAKLKSTLPGVEVVTGVDEFAKKVNEVAEAKGMTVEVRDGIPGYLMEDGRWEAPVAFEADGVIYVNPRLAHVDALIHEFGHIWNSWMRKNNPDELARGIEVVRDTDYHEAVKNHPLYSDLSEEQQLEEALAYAIGDAGRRITEMGPFMRFRVWLADMWRTVGRALGVQRANEMTLLQWANYHAETLLSGNEATRKTGEQIVAEEQQVVLKQRAQAMERAGYYPEDIYAATGWRRSDSGDWYYSDLDVSPKYDETTQFKSGETLPFDEVFTAPALAARVDAKVRIEEGVQSPRLDGDTIVISPVIDKKYMGRVVALAQSTLIKERLDNGPVQDNPVRFAAQTPQTNMAQGSTPQAARMQSARQIIRIEMQNEGMKDYEAKTRQLAKALSLRYEDVLRVWQDEAQAANFGRITVALGDAKAMGLGKWAELKEAAGIKKEILAESISQWFRRYFTAKGLFPAEIKYLADQTGNRIAGRLRGARFLMADLNRAMNEEYGKGKITEAHWRLVDNVMRGEGQWDVLPPKVQAAAKAMRDFTDALSQELITSGATNSKMILTILNNSGVAATEDNMKDWKGVNLFEALDKLPYERSQYEEDMIKDFLKQNNRMLGSYFYRSYRKHRDKHWAKKVPPQVLQDAREYLFKEISNRIAKLEKARDTKIEDVELQIIDVYDAINTLTDDLKTNLADAQAAFVAASDAVKHAQKVTPDLLKAQADAKAELDKWLDEQADTTAVTKADIEVIMNLTEVDLSAYSDRVWAIVEARKRLSDLQDLQDAVLNFNQAEIDNLSRILSVPFGAAQGGIDGIIYNEILATEDVEGIVNASNLGSKDLAFLKRRRNIPEPIRELMGEYHDARLNFASSVMRMISVVENQQLLLQLRHEFEGKHFWPPEMQDMGVELAARGTASMDPLNGWRTTPEIKKAFQDFYNPRVQMPWPIKVLRYLSDMVKYGKTIVSPVTHFRNFFSNLYFALQNGYNPRLISKSWTAFHNAWSQNTDSQRRDYIERLASLGIVGEGAWSGDISSLLERINGDAVDQLMVSGSVWTSVNRFLQQTYQAEDDFWRILGFETEKARYSKAIYGRKFADLDPDQQADIERQAADIVAETMPTYSKVPRFAASLREVPIFGTFIAFPAEMFRVTANQVKRTIKEMRDPRTRGIAMVRALGIGLAQGLPLAAVSMFRHLVGVSDEEEDAARFFVPEWQKNSPWVWENFAPGEEFSFRNLGYSDPYAFYKKPIITLMKNNGEDADSKLAEAAWGLLSPFLDVELTTGTILALAYNKHPQTGEDIYNPGAGILGDWRNSKEFALRQLQPGLVKFGYDVLEAATGEGRYGRPPKQWDDIALNMVGYQTEKTNIDKAVRQQVRAAKRQLDYAREYFIDNKFKYKDDPEGLELLYERTADQYNNALKQLSLCIRNAEIIGVPPGTVNEMVTGSRRGFSKTELEAARTGILLMPTFKDYNK